MTTYEEIEKYLNTNSARATRYSGEGKDFPSLCIKPFTAGKSEAVYTWDMDNNAFDILEALFTFAPKTLSVTDISVLLPPKISLKE